MIVWKDDENLQGCQFRRKPSYQNTMGSNRLLEQHMSYLLIKFILKSLHHSERTSALMRWHVKNLVEDVEVTHLSYAKA